VTAISPKQDKKLPKYFYTISMVSALKKEIKLAVKIDQTARLLLRENNSEIKKRSMLLSENSEYRDQYNYDKKRAIPNLKFWPQDDPHYFALKGKQKWVIK